MNQTNMQNLNSPTYATNNLSNNREEQYSMLQASPFQESSESKWALFMSRYVEFLVPKRPACTNEETPTRFWPPPYTMLATTALIIICLIADLALDRVLLVNLYFVPNQRKDYWRFFTYMFVHNNFLELIVNLAVPLILGVAMEIRHSYKRIIIIYYVGVFCGSLMAGTIDPEEIPLVGASGGTYALIYSHLPYVLIYRNKIPQSSLLVQISALFLITAADFGWALYFRYGVETGKAFSCAGHYGGILTGLCFGIIILRNREEKLRDKVAKYALLLIYVALLFYTAAMNGLGVHKYRTRSYSQ